MSATNTFETQLLQLIFQNSNAANIGDSTGLIGSSTAGSLFLALFTSAPGETGGGIEANYTGYARKAVVRSSAGWTVSGNRASNTAAIEFGACTGGSNTITSFGIFTALTGGTLLIYGTLTASRVVSAGITPEFKLGELKVDID